jgi:hypothetical protein
MILLGFGFGIPVGLVDGAAIGSVPRESSGTAAGVLNFLRLGSEAVAIGFYAAAIHWVISGLVSDPVVADQIAAGGTGHGEIYAQAFRGVQWAVISLTILASIGIVVCHRISLRLSAEAG